jgi:hypothetical protein
MKTDEDLLRGGSSLGGPSIWGSEQPDPPRPTIGLTEGLLRALVIAWDTDQEQRFQHALTAARRYLCLPEPVEESQAVGPVVREDAVLSLVPRAVQAVLRGDN